MAKLKRKPKFSKDSKVQWKWLGKFIEGQVLQTYFEPTTVELKGKKIKRNASEENPAYLVESVAGNRALKLETELENKSVKKKTNTPKLFS